MGIIPVSAITAGQAVQQPASVQGASSTDNSFAKFLSSAIDDASTLSNQADTAASSYAAGGPVSIDQVMIAEQKASLALDLVVQVRDRVVNAYQTIMNMQV